MVGFIQPRNKVPRSWRLLPPVTNNILMQSATTLAKRIRLKKVLIFLNIVSDDIHLNELIIMWDIWSLFISKLLLI